MKQLPASLKASLRGVTLYSDDFVEIHRILKTIGEPVVLRCDRAEFESLDEFAGADTRLLKNGFRFSARKDFDTVSVEFKISAIELYSSKDCVEYSGTFQQLKKYIEERSNFFTRIINEPAFIISTLAIFYVLFLPPFFGFQVEIPNYVLLSSSVIGVLYWLNLFGFIRGNKLFPARKYQGFADRHAVKVWDIAKIAIGGIVGYGIAILQAKLK